MAKIVKPGLNDVVSNINIKEYVYKYPFGAYTGNGSYEDIDYESVQVPIAGLTNALPASNIFSNVYTFIAQEITINFVDTLEAITNSLDNALANITIFDDVSYASDGAVNNGDLPDDYDYEDGVSQNIETGDAPQSQDTQSTDQAAQEEAAPAEENPKPEEKPQEEAAPAEENPKPEEKPQEPVVNPYANSIFTPEVTPHSDGSYTVSSSDSNFNANYLASNTYSSYECAKSARLMAHKRWGGNYFAIGLGDAKYMAATARLSKLYKVSKEPSVGAIITFQPNYCGADSKSGHAAYVDKITYNADGSIKSITLAQTHYSSQGHYYTYDYETIKNNISGIDFIAPRV